MPGFNFGEGTPGRNGRIEETWRAGNWPFKRGLTTKVHVASTSAKFALAFNLSPGNHHDAPEGRKLLAGITSSTAHFILMDKAYEDIETRTVAVKQGFIPVVPPKNNRKKSWEYDKDVYKRRNEVERFILRIKRFRKVFTRYDKLDVVYRGIWLLAMIFDAIIC